VTTAYRKRATAAPLRAHRVWPDGSSPAAARTDQQCFPCMSNIRSLFIAHKPIRKLSTGLPKAFPIKLLYRARAHPSSPKTLTRSKTRSSGSNVRCAVQRLWASELRSVWGGHERSQTPEHCGWWWWHWCDHGQRETSDWGPPVWTEQTQTLKGTQRGRLIKLLPSVPSGNQMSGCRYLKWCDQVNLVCDLTDSNLDDLRSWSEKTGGQMS